MANLHNVRIQYLYDSETNWQSKSDIVSVLGEAYVYVDSEGMCSVKFGDGETTIGALEFSLETAPLQVIEDIPFATGTFTYDGTEQTPTWYYYDGNKMTMSGSTSGVNAGTYWVVFTPKQGYCWSDGSTDSRTATWEIQKAAPDVSISESSISLPHMGYSYYTVIITFPRDAYNAGDYVIMEGGPEFGCSLNEVNSSEGRASFTIYMNEETHSASCIVGLSLSNMSGGNYSDFYIELPVEYVFSKRLEDYTWEEIATISSNGEGPSTFEIGDTKTVRMTDGQIRFPEYWDNADYYEMNFEGCEWEVFIAGFTDEGHILFGGFKMGGVFTCLSYMYLFNNGPLRMATVGYMDEWYNCPDQPSPDCNHSWTFSWRNTLLWNVLGGAASALDPNTNTLMARFPYEIRQYMRLMSTYHSNQNYYLAHDGYNQCRLSVSSEDTYLTIPSAYEVFGERNYEGAYNVGFTVYDSEDSYPSLNLTFFRSGNRRDFRKWEGEGNNMDTRWYLRSAGVAEIGYAYYNSTWDTEGADGGEYSYGVIPIFCI